MPGITNPQWDAIRREARRTANAVVREQLPLFKSEMMQATSEAMAKIIGPVVAKNRNDMGGDQRPDEIKYLTGEWNMPLNYGRAPGKSHAQLMQTTEYLRTHPELCMFSVNGTLVVGPKNRNPIWDAPPPDANPLRHYDNPDFRGPVQWSLPGTTHRLAMTYATLRKHLHQNPNLMAVSIDGIVHLKDIPKPPPSKVNNYFAAFGQLTPELSTAIDSEVDRRVAKRMEEVYSNLFIK